MQRKMLGLALLSWVFTGAIGLGTAYGEPAQPPDQAITQTALTLAKVSNNPRKYIPALTEVGRYLVSGLKDLGITEVRVILARDNDHMIELLRGGNVDLVMETPFSAFAFEDEAGAEILLRQWKNGVPAYHTVFFTRKDSPVRSLSDLPGKTIAFEDPGSTSAFHVPMLTLRREGIPVLDASAPGSTKSDAAVNFVFAGDEINIVGWVARGRADAGTLSNLEWSSPHKVPLGLRRELRIFHETAPIIRAVLLVRGGLPVPLKSRLKELLLGMHHTPEGRAALELLGVSKHDEMTGQKAEELENARRLYDGSR